MRHALAGIVLLVLLGGTAVEAAPDQLTFDLYQRLKQVPTQRDIIALCDASTQESINYYAKGGGQFETVGAERRGTDEILWLATRSASSTGRMVVVGIHFRRAANGARYVTSMEFYGNTPDQLRTQVAHCRYPLTSLR